MTLTPTSSRFTQSDADALYIADTLFDAKGDLIGASAADTAARLAVGTDNQVLTADAAQALGIKWAAATSLVAELFDSTLGADAAAIDSGAGGFSTALDHLLVMLYMRTTEAVVQSSVLLTFNNDTGANYDGQRISVTNTTVSGGIGLAAANYSLPALGANAQASAFTPALVVVPSYAQTTGHKGVFSLAGAVEDTAADCLTQLKAGRWRSMVAISRVILTAGSGNLLTGTRMTVYGVG